MDPNVTQQLFDEILQQQLPPIPPKPNQPTTQTTAIEQQQVQTSSMPPQNQPTNPMQTNKIFNTSEEAYQFYLDYAKNKGFGIRKNTTRKLKSGVINKKQFVCSKEGEKRIDDGALYHKKGETRTGCKAHMWITLNSETGMWEITKFDDNHNHEMTTPTSVDFIPSHNTTHREEGVRQTMHELYDQAIGPSTIARVMSAITDKEITAKQVSNFVLQGRANNIGKEAMHIIQHFQDKAKSDPTFFFSMEIDEDQRLRSVFWADGRAIQDYQEFSDVIVFDVTYQTNKFGLPFAPFTGVNHHKQSTLFGCALLADEKEETFVWLFKQWLQCMSNTLPGVIITDQDPAICKAVSIVFPTTRHRYCSWHVHKHWLQHLPLLNDKSSKFNEDWYLWFNMDDIKKSERLWKGMIEEYKLQDNNWLMNLYAKRKHWVPVFWMDVFTAGMRSSQRSESINAFFDGFVNQATPLNKFVEQYELAILKRRRDEKREDYKTRDERPKLTTDLEMEKQASEHYTRLMFKCFQFEFTNSTNYWMSKKTKGEVINEYIVQRANSPTYLAKSVRLSTVNDEIDMSCSCAKFETEGILCRHIIYMMKRKGIKLIPDKYLLRRWSIAARFQSTTMPESSTNQAEISTLRKLKVKSTFMKVYEAACGSQQLFNELEQFLNNKYNEHSLDNEVEEQDEEQIEDSTMQIEASTMMQIHVRDPAEHVRHKGRPKKLERIKSGAEISQSQVEARKRQNQCGNCKEMGHNKQTCPQLKK